MSTHQQAQAGASFFVARGNIHLNLQLHADV